MAKVKVTTRFKILELIDRFVDGTLVNQVGGAVVDEAKQLIRSGQSPVRGYGRFAAYKDRDKYPGGIKPARPVNLELSGDMLDAYGYRRGAGDSIEVGMVKGSPEVKEIAEFHNEGTEHMAQRRIVPGEGEEWTVSIMRRIRDFFGKRFETLIRQANKKR